MSEFSVSEKREMIWERELEIFRVFKDICEKNHLKYYVIAGTLLGCIRHKGFIPWDDDFDVAMPRSDYEKFIQIAKSSIKEPLFLQCSATDIGYYYGHAKIRNSNTTAIRMANWKSGVKFNQGIFIDVFPLDNVPDNENERKRHCYIATKVQTIMKESEYYFKEESEHSVMTVIRHTLNKATMWVLGGRNIEKYYQKIVQRYNHITTKKIGLISEFYGTDRFIWNASDFSNSKEMSFQGEMVRVPSGYLNILRKSYGEWETPLSTGGEHGSAFFDTEKSYVEYLPYYERYKDIDLKI